MTSGGLWWDCFAKDINSNSIFNHIKATTRTENWESNICLKLFFHIRWPTFPVLSNPGDKTQLLTSNLIFTSRGRNGCRAFKQCQCPRHQNGSCLTSMLHDESLTLLQTILDNYIAFILSTKHGRFIWSTLRFGYEVRSQCISRRLSYGPYELVPQNVPAS